VRATGGEIRKVVKAEQAGGAALVIVREADAKWDGGRK